jgi:hypothetical protein
LPLFAFVVLFSNFCWSDATFDDDLAAFFTPAGTVLASELFLMSDFFSAGLLKLAALPRAGPFGSPVKFGLALVVGFLAPFTTSGPFAPGFVLQLVTTSGLLDAGRVFVWGADAVLVGDGLRVRRFGGVVWRLIGAVFGLVFVGVGLRDFVGLGFSLKVDSSGLTGGLTAEGWM